MNFSLDFSSYTLWSVYTTIAFFLLAVLAFIFKWGFRFRLVGTTGFMGVLTVGLFALSLGLFSNVTVDGALRYNLIYDTGANQTVIAVPLDITPTQLEATLKQASINLFSYGRGESNNDNKLTVRARVQVHEDGFTYPIYLGQIKSSLTKRDDDDAQTTIFSDEFKRRDMLINS